LAALPTVVFVRVKNGENALFSAIAAAHSRALQYRTVEQKNVELTAEEKLRKMHESGG
jgi:hypothetical protein